MTFRVRGWFFFAIFWFWSYNMLWVTLSLIVILNLLFGIHRHTVIGVFEMLVVCLQILFYLLILKSIWDIDWLCWFFCAIPLIFIFISIFYFINEPIFFLNIFRVFRCFFFGVLQDFDLFFEVLDLFVFYGWWEQGLVEITGL